MSENQPTNSDDSQYLFREIPPSISGHSNRDHSMSGHSMSGHSIQGNSIGGYSSHVALDAPVNSHPVVIAMVRLLAFYWIIESGMQFFWLLSMSVNYYPGAMPGQFGVSPIYLLGFALKLALAILIFLFAPGIARILSAESLVRKMGPSDQRPF